MTESPATPTQLEFRDDLTRSDQILLRFERFHRANPAVWSLFVRFADQIRAVRKRWSADAVLHRIRWEVAIQTTSAPNEHPKINNDYAAYYGRMYVLARPEADGFFQFRRRVSKDKPAYDKDLPVCYSGPAGNEADLSRRLALLIQGNSE